MTTQTRPTVCPRFNPAILGRDNDRLGVYWFKRHLHGVLSREGYKLSNVVASTAKPKSDEQRRFAAVAAKAARSRAWKRRIRSIRASC